MSKILFNLHGKQHLIEVGVGGSVTSDAQILWDERLHGSIPNDIELGKMEAYDELENVTDVLGNIEYLPEREENGEYVLDENGNVVLSNQPRQISVRKLRKLQNVIESHANKLQEETQKEINRQARAYLASTDWYVIRKEETGVAIPQEILDARAAARASIVE